MSRNRYARDKFGPCGEHAWVGEKKCGCKVFARLTTYTGRRVTPLEDACKGLTVRRVPAKDARLDVCRCKRKAAA